MSDLEERGALACELRVELTERILPYWLEHAIDSEHGGFFGRIRQDGVVVSYSPKGAVLNGRILWTFAAASRVIGNAGYRRAAERAYRYVVEQFVDPVHGGVYWSLDHLGRPLETTKKIYAQAFVMYGLSEYYRAFGDPDALEAAAQLFGLIETRGHDSEFGGYLESFGRSWEDLEDVRLSEKDMNAAKSMNTHLHVLEAYANLLRVWDNDLLRRRLRRLVELLVDVIADPNTAQMRLFFDRDWTLRSSVTSFGHDIEASWLLLDAVDVLADADLRERVLEPSLMLAQITLEQGLDDDGGLFYEKAADGTIDTDKHWWPQAEAVVGFLYAHRESGERRFLDAAISAWDFTKKHVFDLAGGEWFGRLHRDGTPYEDEDKVGLWKCPYHNARACIEGMKLAGVTETVHK